jgi:single-stranded DNA-binding protein
MSAFALVTGVIFRAPVQKISKAGKPFTNCTIRAGSDDSGGGDFWSIICFSESAGAELLRLAIGERVAVQGSMKVELYSAASDGKTKISRTVFVDHVMPLRQPPKERKPKKSAADAPLETPAKETAAGGPAFFDDDIPFGPVR